MNIFSVILIALAIVIFVATHYGVARRWANIALGLALLSSGLLLHALLKTEHLLTITWD